MEFTETNQGKRRLHKDGYQYVFQKSLADNVQSWECTNRRHQRQCKARIKLDGLDQFIEQVNVHTHEPNPEIVSVVRARLNMKRRATTTEVSKVDYFCSHLITLRIHI